MIREFAVFQLYILYLLKLHLPFRKAMQGKFYCCYFTNRKCQASDSWIYGSPYDQERPHLATTNIRGMEQTLNLRLIEIEQNNKVSQADQTADQFGNRV